MVKVDGAPPSPNPAPVLPSGVNDGKCNVFVIMPVVKELNLFILIHSECNTTCFDDDYLFELSNSRTVSSIRLYEVFMH